MYTQSNDAVISVCDRSRLVLFHADALFCNLYYSGAVKKKSRKMERKNTSKRELQKPIWRQQNPFPLWMQQSNKNVYFPWQCNQPILTESAVIVLDWKMSVKINCNRFRGLTESVDESDICTASQLLCGCGRDVADFQTQPQQHYVRIGLWKILI